MDDQPAPSPLSGPSRTPPWLRDIGLGAWLLVGVTLAAVGVVWLLSLTDTIVMPVIAAAVIAAVASPVVGALVKRGMPRGAASAVMLVALIVGGIAIFAAVIGGITSQLDALKPQIADAKDEIASWATDLGLDSDTAATAKEDAATAVSDAIPALLKGVGGGLQSLSSLVVFLSLTALSLFFLLKDGPEIRRWAERHSHLPDALARTITQRMLEALRGYFLGVTLVAAFNAVLVGGGALLLGIPLAGTIAAVTFVGAYIPYLGAWGAGAFSVLLALGGAGPEEAAAMVVIQLLANGILQQMIQPIAYGAALGIHPLAVLIVTIGGGALFGAAGLILAAPVTAALAKIVGDFEDDEAVEPEAAAADAAPRLAVSPT